MKKTTKCFAVIGMLLAASAANAGSIKSIESVCDRHGSFAGAKYAPMKARTAYVAHSAGSAQFGYSLLAKFKRSGIHTVKYTPRSLQSTIGGSRGFWNAMASIKRLLIMSYEAPKPEEQSVPEPSALAMLGFGLMLMGGVAARRRRQAA